MVYIIICTVWYIPFCIGIYYGIYHTVCYMVYIIYIEGIYNHMYVLIYHGIYHNTLVISHIIWVLFSRICPCASAQQPRSSRRRFSVWLGTALLLDSVKCSLQVCFCSAKSQLLPEVMIQKKSEQIAIFFRLTPP